MNKIASEMETKLKKVGVQMELLSRRIEVLADRMDSVSDSNAVLNVTT